MKKDIKLFLLLLIISIVIVFILLVLFLFYSNPIRGVRGYSNTIEESIKEGRFSIEYRPHKMTFVIDSICFQINSVFIEKGWEEITKKKYTNQEIPQQLILVTDKKISNLGYMRYWLICGNGDLYFEEVGNNSIGCPIDEMYIKNTIILTIQRERYNYNKNLVYDTIFLYKEIR